MTREDYLNKKTWAVVGASDKRDKFGNRIYRRLKLAGYKVYAVNPGLQTIDGDPCYPNLASLPAKPDVIDMVVNPARGPA
jgi:predicted CoA-binding protein